MVHCHVQVLGKGTAVRGQSRTFHAYVWQKEACLLYAAPHKSRVKCELYVHNDATEAHIQHNICNVKLWAGLEYRKMFAVLHYVNTTKLFV